MSVTKREYYEDLYDQITAAVNAEFYLEAAWLEYAFMEDRTTNALAWAGGRVLDKKGKRIARPSLESKLSALKARLPSNPELMRAMRGAAVLDAAQRWRKRRNTLAHALASSVKPWSTVKADAKSLAEDGLAVVRDLSSAGMRLRRRARRRGRSKKAV